MFERFTERAREVVVLAQDEARGLKHNYIGSEHILLALLRQREGVAAQVLDSYDLTLAAARAQVASTVGPADKPTSGQIPLTPQAKKVLELGLREAMSLQHRYIGPEHVLLGLVREKRGVAADILKQFDVEAEEVRNRVQMLTGSGRRPTDSSFAEEEEASFSADLRPPEPQKLIVVGWLLFGVSLGLGVLVGWAIWGL